MCPHQSQNIVLCTRMARAEWEDDIDRILPKNGHRFTTIRCQFGGTKLSEWITNKTIINSCIFPIAVCACQLPSYYSSPIQPLWTLIFQWSFTVKTHKKKSPVSVPKGTDCDRWRLNKYPPTLYYYFNYFSKGPSNHCHCPLSHHTYTGRRGFARHLGLLCEDIVCAIKNCLKARLTIGIIINLQHNDTVTLPLPPPLSI